MDGPATEDFGNLLDAERWDSPTEVRLAAALAKSWDRTRHAETHLNLAAANVNRLDAENRILRAALSRLAGCAFGPPGELLAAADAARELLGE